MDEGKGMLVLSRKVGERIFIGEDIIITLCDIQGSKCRLGISAPRGIQILREELKEKPNEGQPTKAE